MTKVTLESVAAEFRSGNSVPVERATLTRTRMQEVLEAYAAAKVREALEQAAHIIETNAAGCNEMTLYILHSQIAIIRALPPSTPA